MTDTPGLRQRQREQTWRDLHEAAVGLARDHGVDGATIEAIAEQAGVSRRTFFNYYPSKEDAILGLNAPHVSPAAVEAFRSQAGEALFPAVIQLVSSVWRSTVVVDIGRPARRSIVQEFPDVRGRLAEHSGVVEQQVMSIIVDGDSDHDLGLDDDPRTLRSLVLLAGAVLKVTDGPDGSATTPRSQETIDDTISLFTRLLNGEN